MQFAFREDESYSIEEVESKFHTPVLRRSKYERREPKRYNPPDFCSYFSLCITNEDPRIVNEVVNYEEANIWEEAMNEEMIYLEKSKTWDLVNFLLKMAIGYKWIFKKKQNDEGKM